MTMIAIKDSSTTIFFFVFELEYSCFTLLCQFLLYSKVNQPYIYIYPLIFWISFPFRSPQSTEQSSLCYTVGSHQLSILYIVVCICQFQSPNSSHHPFFPLRILYIYSLCLYLYFCFANKIIYTIFLDSTYTC